MGLKKKDISKFGLVALFFTVLLYNFHRYIFSYNFEGTSPTYTTTPLIWQVGKYVVIPILLIFFYSGLDYTGRISKKILLVYVWILFVLLLNVLNYLFWNEFITDEIEYCYWFMVLLPFCFSKTTLSSLNIDFEKLLYYSCGILFIGNFYVIANFYLTGRLPALGYEGGLVRFGSLWDDPNSFGIVCVFLLFYFLEKKKYLLAILSCFNILFTYSFASYLLCIASLGFWVFRSYKTLDLKWLKLSIFLFILLIIVVVKYFDKLYDLYLIKEESVLTHLNQPMLFNLFPLENVGIQVSENWYKSTFYNYFPFVLFLWAYLIKFFFKLFENDDNRLLKFYFFIFILSMFFFSMLYTFPLNFVFVFIFIDYLKENQNRQNQVAKS